MKRVIHMQKDFPNDNQVYCGKEVVKFCLPTTDNILLVTCESCKKYYIPKGNKRV